MIYFYFIIIEFRFAINTEMNIIIIIIFYIIKKYFKGDENNFIKFIY